MNALRLGIYRHYKGNEYDVIGVAKHSETLEEMVIYRARNENGQTWARPLRVFLEDVVVDDERVPRFLFIDV